MCQDFLQKNNKIITKKTSLTHTGHGTNRYATLFAVAPAIIMLPDIAHLDLVAGRIAGRIGQNPALEGLHQRPLRHTCDVGTHPIGITDGVTKCHHPIKQLAIAIAPTAIDQPTLIEEGAKHIGDVVTCLGDILRIADVGGGVISWKVPLRNNCVRTAWPVLSAWAGNTIVTTTPLSPAP